MSFPAKLKDEGTVKSGMVIYTDTTKIKKISKILYEIVGLLIIFFLNCFQGTVVIGKVESGSCSKGQTLAVYPNRQEVKVDQVIIT
jgi:hypothetical protein